DDAAEDAHERRLAGTVAADEAEHLARRYREADLGVGQRRAKALGDAGQGNERGGSGRRRGLGRERGVVYEGHSPSHGDSRSAAGTRGGPAAGSAGGTVNQSASRLSWTHSSE